MLKILVVEDNQEKLQKVVAALLETPGVQREMIDVAHDGIEGKSCLRASHYDLVVLDIALPERPDAMPSPEGGISLLQEVLDRDVYKRPREVIGLTAFPDVREKVGPRFAEDLWAVIQYDPTTDAWAEQLKRKVRYIQMSLSPDVALEYNCELCVVTALVSPELEAVLNLPWNWSQCEVPGDGMLYHNGSYVANGQHRKVVAAASPRMGMTAAAITAAKMVQHFRPRYMAIVGIAAGVRGTCELGDVIAADPVWDWGSGKQYLEGGSSVFAAAPHQIALNSYIRGKLSNLSQNPQAFDEIRRAFPAEKPNTVLTMRVGPLACGASVLADTSAIRSIQQQHRKLVGVDMESYGVLAAAHEASLPTPKAFALKSVCDFADEQKNDHMQAYAAYTSAATLRIFVEHYLSDLSAQQH